MKFNCDGNMQLSSGIYKIRNTVTNKAYIGSTTKFIRRYNNHLNKLNKSEHDNTALQYDWNKYGKDNFSFEIVEIVDDSLLLPQKEWEYIQIQNDYYNVSDPRQEYIKGRIPQPKTVKGSEKHNGEYFYLSSYIFDYLNFYHYEHIKKLYEHLGTDNFFLKSKVDDWFKENIKDTKIKSDERIEGILNDWYKMNMLNIIYSNPYKNQLNTDIEHEFLIVSNELFRELIKEKFNIEKKDSKKQLQQKTLKSNAFIVDLLYKENEDYINRIRHNKTRDEFIKDEVLVNHLSKLNTTKEAYTILRILYGFNGVREKSIELKKQSKKQNKNSKHVEKIVTKKLIKSDETKKQITLMKNEVNTNFDYLFEKLTHKLNQVFYLPYEQIHNYIIERLESNYRLDDKYKSECIDRVLREKGYSILSLDHERYDRNILKKLGIKEFKKSILKRENSNVIFEELRKLKTKTD